MHLLWLLQWSGGARATVPALIAASGPFAKVVLVILLIMSVYSWAVIWNRTRLYARVASADRAFLGAFRRLPPHADLRLVCDQEKIHNVFRITGQTKVFPIHDTLADALAAPSGGTP